jgi:hypothetical protein
MLAGALWGEPSSSTCRAIRKTFRQLDHPGERHGGRASIPRKRRTARREGAGRSVEACRGTVPYGLVVVSEKVPLPLYEYTRQR